ncbi:hypothetical protein [Peredibacter starrii]|uniref:Rod shape-determining protein MreB n=1 Tax=Peredibacter starrii TaxID=28202 RepID=A0AAX4HIT0_9BACT|nr:hypothetical protein [Peredibacter starrii]WPU63154.1 hypothetical protein SOO65_10705 [Peredibacter starrii]
MWGFHSLVFLVLLTACHVNSACIQGKGGHDLLAMVVENAKACPQNVREFKSLLAADGITTRPAMVANRGAHNPKEGSFSIFESAIGFSKGLNIKVNPEFLYFGHFTGLNSQKEILLDQESVPGKLLIEAIAFDFKKNVYNFYELVGTSNGPQWFYRGDSFDAYEDNKFLKIGERPQFGTKMRCSACHNSGGPIMKELAFPHNDWWNKRTGLPFAPNKLSEEMKQYLSQFIDASEFSQNVKRGLLLVENKRISKRRSLQEQLRPLFCSTEINLVSDVKPLSSPVGVIDVSSEVFVDPLLAPKGVLRMEKRLYLTALQVLGFRFPETILQDAGHAFLAPVRSEVNQLQVQQLIAEKVISEEFAVDILSVDFKNPLFSKKRCELLKLVPENSSWEEGFKKNLYGINTEISLKLAYDLETQNKEEHRKIATQYLITKQAFWKDQKQVIDEMRQLNVLRQSVFDDEISKNPRGQILEPGFRVIFPVLAK